MLGETETLLWPKAEELSLEDTLNELDEWRSKKKGSRTKIPELLSMKIVALSKKYSTGRICALFSISGSQLKNKTKHFEKMGYLKATQAPEPEIPDFQEVKPRLSTLKKEEVQNLVQKNDKNIPFPEAVRRPKLKLDRNTMIVEFCNGKNKMSLHVTQETLPELMDAFFSRGT